MCNIPLINYQTLSKLTEKRSLLLLLLFLIFKDNICRVKKHMIENYLKKIKLSFKTVKFQRGSRNDKRFFPIFSYFSYDLHLHKYVSVLTE